MGPLTAGMAFAQADVAFSPANGIVDCGETLYVDVTIDGSISDMRGFSFTFQFDDSIVKPVSVVEGDLLTNAPCGNFFLWVNESTFTNTIEIDATLLGCSVAGPGSLIRIGFQPAGKIGVSDLITVSGVMRDSNNLDIPFTAPSGTIENICPDGNQPPLAQDDEVTTDEDTALVIDVLADNGNGPDIDVNGNLDPGSVVVVDDPLFGSVINHGDGTVTYTPDPNFFGSDSFTYTVSDLLGAVSNLATVTVTVVSVNDLPVAEDDDIITSEDLPITIDVLVDNGNGADSDIDGTLVPGTVLIVNGPQNGTARNNGDGTILYTPDPNFFGSDSFTYTVEDNDGGVSNQALVAISVISINDPPVAVYDAVSTDEDNAVTVDVLANNGNGPDFDVDSAIDPASVVVVVGPTSGSLVNHGDGTVTYTPDLNYFGNDTFSYTVDDIEGATSNIAVVTIGVIDVNDPPVAVYDVDDTAEDTALTIDVLANNGNGPDIDIDGFLVPSTVTLVGLPGSGTALNNGDGTITYTPDPQFFGGDSFSYTVNDNDGAVSNVAVVTITVTPVNDAPVVADIPDQSVPEGGSFTAIDLNSYVSDEDNLPGEMSWAASGQVELGVSIVGNVATVSIPDPDWNGSETVTFTATDPGGLSDFDGATFSVSAVNDPPVVGDIPDQEISEGSSFTAIDLNSYVSDEDNLPGEMSWAASGQVELGVSIVGNVATVSIPDPDWNGSETVTFTATDPGGRSDFDAATFTVSAVNDPPVVGDIPDQEIPEGSSFTAIDLNSYVSDVDNLPGEMSWAASGQVELGVSIVGNVATVSIPDPDWNGSETVTFTATDPGGLSDFDGATFSVSAVNDPPVVGDIPDQEIPEGSSFTTIDLNSYVSDVDNLPGEMSWAASGQVELGVSIIGNVATVSIPDPDWNGSETVTFTATDPGGLSDFDGATFTVTAVNDPPVVANIPNRQIVEGSTFIPLNLNNYVQDVDNADSELDWVATGQVELDVSIVDNVATVSVPDPDWNGSETVTFTVTDPGGLSDFDDVTFTVTAVNDQPVVSDIPDQEITEGGSFTAIDLNSYVNDVDNADSEIDWVATGQVELAVSIVGNVATVNIPDPDWNGSETVVFTATDPGGLSDFDDVTFTVTGVNDQPVVGDIPDQEIAEGSSFTAIDLNSYVSDVDNLPGEMSWAATGQVELAVSITGNVATVTIPDPDWNGRETITFTASDPGGLSDFDAATFTATAVNDPPVVANIPDRQITEGSSFLALNLNDYVQDVDNVDSEIDWVATGQVELVVSIVDNVATVNIPDPDWNGSETVTFTATDPGGLSDFDDVALTVTAVNDQPVVGDIPDQEITEGGSFTAIDLNSYVSDVDNLPGEMSWAASGQGELAVSIVGNVATVSVPDPDWNGSETVTFTATDPGGLSDFDAATFAVSGVNDAPVVGDIPDQQIVEGDSFATIDLSSYVSDVDNLPGEMTWIATGQAELAVNITGNVATVTTPHPDWNGDETITFTATDPGGLSDLDAVSFTVTAVNDPPTIADPGPQEDVELDEITLQIFAQDIEDTDLVYSAFNLPTGLSIDPDTGLITGRVACAASLESPFTVEIRVDDGNGGIKSLFLSWTISPRPLPASITDLAATQVKSGNDTDGTTRIMITWSDVSENFSVEVFRKGFGSYPEYDDTGGTLPTPPATPTQAVADGWTPVPDLTRSGNFDEITDRGSWHYVAFVANECGGRSGVSNLTAGTLNYHLGDVSDGAEGGQGDNAVLAEDVSLLGFHYGVVEGDPLYLAYLDIGPTSNLSVDGRPLTDNQLDFEDLMMFSLNFQGVSKGAPSLEPFRNNAMMVYVPEDPKADGTLDVHLWMQGDGNIQGLSIALDWDAEIVEPLEILEGDYLATQGGYTRILSPDLAAIDAALFGIREVAMSGEGLMAKVRFRMLKPGDPGIAITKVLARDNENHALNLEATVEMGLPDHLNIPEVSRIYKNYPNPFNPNTTIAFGVAVQGRVTVTIYSIDGQLVKSFVDEQFIPGTYRRIWDGTNNRGARLASGMYLARLVAPDKTQVHRMMLIK